MRHSIYPTAFRLHSDCRVPTSNSRLGLRTSDTELPCSESSAYVMQDPLHGTACLPRHLHQINHTSVVRARRAIAYKGWPKKVSHKILSISSPNIDRFSKFFTAAFCEKFVVEWLLNIPPHLNCVATLPCEI